MLVMGLVLVFVMTILGLALFNVASTAVINVLMPDRYIGGAIAFVVGLITFIGVASLTGPRKSTSQITLVKRSASEVIKM